MNNWMCDIFSLYKYFLLLCVTLCVPLEIMRERRAKMYFFLLVDYFQLALLPLPVLRCEEDAFLSLATQLPTRHHPATNEEVIRLNEAKK